MRRFLIYLSYSGTRLRGVQKAPNEELTNILPSVQGLLEAGLLNFKSENTPASVFSSRTDKGVHAVSNTVHVDLCRKNGQFYDPEFITRQLNKHFSKTEVDIRVHKTIEVPAGFHARFCAIGRSYLYRLCVLKPGSEDFGKIHIHSCLPQIELHNVHIVRSPFDIEKFVSGSQLFKGSHNFATFMHSPSKSSPPVDSNRSIDSITVTEGRPLLNPVYDPLYENLQFWDVNISAKSFLYNQVRRIVGALIGAAQDRLTLNCIQWMLDNPAPQNWNPRAVPAPAKGLYLLGVKYPPEVFEESYYKDQLRETTQTTSTIVENYKKAHNDAEES